MTYLTYCRVASQFFVCGASAAFSICNANPLQRVRLELGLWSRPGLCLTVVWLGFEHYWQGCLAIIETYATENPISCPCYIWLSKELNEGIRAGPLLIGWTGLTAGLKPGPTYKLSIYLDENAIHTF